MSKIGKEYQLAIRIAGTIDKSFDVSLSAANTKLKSTILKIDSDFVKLDKGFDKIMGAGQKCFQAIATAASVAAAAIGAATVASIKVGSEFESAFAGVKKTVDATEEEYAKLREDILKMTRTIPEYASEIAGVMEIAGQLGIAKENLTDFTETMINLGVSTNMSAEDAATYLAKFANIVSMADYGEDGISNWERLGSVVVDLGNKFATTEEDIVTMATRLASTGDLVGLTEAQIMALSTAMSAVGIQDEVGGSTMSKLLKKIQLAVELNSDALNDYAAVAGMTGEEFSQVFQEDAVVALSAFIDGLNDTERNGKSAIAILDEMGLKEIRLSNTILALSNAEGVMTNAIATANAAWDENSALAIEAGKRYETVESQAVLARNAFQELGIEAYDEMRPMIVSALSAVTDKVHDFSDSNTIQKWIRNISAEFPTMKRKFTQFAAPVFNGIVDGGKWIIKNGKVIISVIAGFGAALAAYKIASTISHIVTAVMSLASLNPVTAGILILVAAIGTLAGAIAYYKQYEQALVDESLQRHFGNIVLSMEEIQKVAEYIVSSDSLGGVKRALEAFEDLNTISATIEDTVSELDKLNWKVSIGMELTADEKESYKQAIADYVEASQEYALQSQYAVHLNLSFGLSSDDLESQNVITKVNQFYADKYDELSALGTQLNEAVTDAFNDGLLDIKETQVIADIQRQMAEIQQSLATGEFDAQLSVLGMEYAGGGSLSADSFKNLQEELANQVAEATEAYREAYIKNYASIQAAYEAGEYLSESEYQAAIESLQEEYLANVASLQARAINFQMDTIMNQYADELDPAVASYMQSIDETMKTYMENGEYDWMERPVLLWEAMLMALEDNELDKTTREAISQLLKYMEPSVKDMEALRKQYEDMGQALPESFSAGLYNYMLLDALANQNYESIEHILGEQMVGSEYYDSFYKNIIDQLYDMDYYVPEGVAEEISNAAAVFTEESINAAAEANIRPAVEGMYAWSQEAIDEYYSGGFDATADVRVNLTPLMRYNSLPALSQNIGLPLPNIDHNANGNIIWNKELSWVAEKGPESIIPLDGSRRAVSLWERTGQLLGMESAFDQLDLDAGSSNATIEYKPTLNFYGEAPSKDDLTEALSISEEEFNTLMDKYFRTHSRVSFG